MLPKLFPTVLAAPSFNSKGVPKDLGTNEKEGVGVGVVGVVGTGVGVGGVGVGFGVVGRGVVGLPPLIPAVVDLVP